MKKLTLLSAACLALAIPSASQVFADTWSDKDGGAFVVIKNGYLSIYSTDSFYIFDELFSAVRKGSQLRLCIGPYQGTGMASDCLGSFIPEARFNNEGKTRSLHFSIRQYPYIFNSYETFLKSGSEMKLSIDNGDLFASYQLNKIYKLTTSATAILELPD